MRAMEYPKLFLMHGLAFNSRLDVAIGVVALSGAQGRCWRS